MRRGLVLLLCAGLSSCWGYSISPCGDNNKVQFEESGDAVLTCTGITHNDMVWRLTDTGGTVSQIGACYWPGDSCSVTDMDSDYSLSRPQKASSVLTVTDNLRTKIAGTVQCAGLSGGAMGGTVNCEVRVVYTSYQVTNCTVKVTTSTSTWTVSGSCDVDKIYASDDQYSCRWFETPQTGSGTRSLTGSMDLVSSFTEEGRLYHKATCHLGLQPMPTADGVYSYSLEIDPSNGPHSAHTVTIHPPSSPPQISGNTTRMEGDSLVLNCTVTGGNPPVDYVTFYCWNNHGDMPDSVSTENGQTVVTSTIEIDSLTARDNGSPCLCSATWNPRSALYQATATVTILVLGAVSEDTTTESPDTSTTPTAPTAPSTQSSSSSSNGDSANMDANDDDPVPLIAGVVAAAVIVIIIVIVVIAVVFKRRKRKPRKEDNRTKDGGDDEEFEEHVNIMYESSDNVSPPSIKPSAVAFRIPAAENSSAPRRDVGAPASDATDPEQNYSTIPSQYFQSPAENGNVTYTAHGPRSSANRPENNPHSDYDNELDPYSSIDGAYDDSAPNPDTDPYSSADPAPENPVVVVPAKAPQEDAGAYAVVNKRDSKKQLTPQNNDYAVVNKSRTSSSSNAGPDSTEDPDSPSERYVYAEVNKKSKGSNPESAPRPPKQEAEPYAQVQKPKPVPAAKPKPAVAPKPSVAAKPKQGGASSNETPGQGRPRVTSDYEEVDLPPNEATPVTEDDYNTLAFHRRPSADIREDPEAEYSHITAI